MPSFGSSSERELRTVHHDLNIIAYRSIEIYDFKVIQGARNIERQIINIRNGVSKTIDSRHIPRDAEGNYDPEEKGMAVDLAPWPVKWPTDEEPKHANRFYYMQGILRAVAEDEDIKIIQGVDWDSDGDFYDQSFDDLPHLQLAKKIPRLIVPTELIGEVNDALMTRGLPPWVNR